MPKFVDYDVTGEVTDIMERIAEKFPVVFPSFDVNQVGATMTKGKKARKPARLIPVRYPFSVWLASKVYIVEVFYDMWTEMNQKQRNIAVFHVMCAIPEGEFDTESKDYGRRRVPDYELYHEEFAVSGGHPDWMDNPDDIPDVLDAAMGENVDKNPVTADQIASV